MEEQIVELAEEDDIENDLIPKIEEMIKELRDMSHDSLAVV
jgi:hypothetical protein